MAPLFESIHGTAVFSFEHALGPAARPPLRSAAVWLTRSDVPCGRPHRLADWEDLVVICMTPLFFCPARTTGGVESRSAGDLKGWNAGGSSNSVPRHSPGTLKKSTRLQSAGDTVQ